MFIVSNQVILPVQNISYTTKTLARKRAINGYFSKKILILINLHHYHFYISHISTLKECV
jgi:hypothetical protein